MGVTEDQARAVQRQYLREWRRKNPDKVKAYNRRYWERRAEKTAVEKGGEVSVKEEQKMLNVTALKRMENVASIINCADGRTQDRMWEALEGILTEEEVAGLKQYATLYHMFTDDSFFNEVQNMVGQMLVESLK